MGTTAGTLEGMERYLNISSAAKMAGVDRKTIAGNVAPNAVYISTDGKEHPLWSTQNIQGFIDFNADPS